MADLNIILCPDCGKKIPVSEALTHQLEEKIKGDLNKQLKDIEKQRKLLEENQKSQKEEFEKLMRQKEDELKEQGRKFLLEQKQKLKEEAEKQARTEIQLEFEDLKKQNEENQKKLAESQKLELELRAERRKLEEAQKNLELDIQRKLDEEREKLSLNIQKDQEEKFKLQSLEYEKKLNDMQKALEEAQRKGNATSERFRGEVREIDIEANLLSTFGTDEIKEVPKGINGADIIQIVKDNFGKTYGKIVWESKRTKNFNQEWIKKLKDDVIRAEGNFAILVTQTLPEGVNRFDFINGVWVCDFSSYIQLANVLRMQLFELKRVEKMHDGKDQKMSLVYEYLTTDQFKNKIIAVVETFKMMHDQLEKEKRAFNKLWAEREMQIRRMTDGTVSIIGDLQGLMGNSLPTIEGIDLPYLE
jgi:hypothetical protein